MPVISIRSLHFKHINEAVRIRDSKKKVDMLETPARKGKAYAVYRKDL